MFEKEAKKHKEEFITSYISLGGGLKSAGVIGMQKELSYKEGAEFGYNKANEWHYVKDGDLPNTENLECLCIIRPLQDNNEKLPNKDFRGVLYFRNGMFYLDEDNCNDCLKEINSDFTDLVIAWKEIVLPKEVKENDNGSCWKRD